MNYHSFDELLSYYGGVRFDSIRAVAREVAQYCSFAVFSWKEAPDELKKLCDQGGDEDWVVVTRHTHSLIPSWVEKLDWVSDPVYYDLLDTLVIVSTHA